MKKTSKSKKAVKTTLGSARRGKTVVKASKTAKKRASVARKVPMAKPKFQFGGKAMFIRSKPDSMSAKDVVAAAAKVGLKISVNHVYNLRAAALGRTIKVGRPKKSLISIRTPQAPDEETLRMAILNLGLGRSQEIINNFREKVLA